MSAGETITVVTPILGRIQCAPGFATTTLYVTIVGQQPFAKRPQSENQHFCMVRTQSMGSSFMLVEYPNMGRVLKATNTSSGIGGTKVIVEAVGKEGEYLVNGGKLPRDFGKEYHYRLDRISEGTKYHIFSDSNMDGSKTLIQTGYGDAHGGKENEPIVIDAYSNVPWEIFTFENPPPN